MDSYFLAKSRPPKASSIIRRASFSSRCTFSSFNIDVVQVLMTLNTGITSLLDNYFFLSKYYCHILGELILFFDTIIIRNV